jgi:UDP-N-acetylmuramyl pentapeptide phosphotransferase/UDP-N-acetylglucosamine-1-phosphate transferase
MTIEATVLAAIMAAIFCAAALLLLERMTPAGFLAAQIRGKPEHHRAVRQLGGLAVIPAALLVGAFAPEIAGDGDARLFAAGVLLLWLLGLADDRFHVGPLPKIACQAIVAVAIAFAVTPALTISAGVLPWWIERIAVAGAIVWFINMTNFMDGLDLMTVIGFGMPLVACALLVLHHAPEHAVAAESLIVAGALAGFAAFNIPPARLYLGDSGSLALGFGGGFLAFQAAAIYGVAAAVIPFAYYLADTISTLALRVRDGENLLTAHQRHAYQAARRAGESEWRILATVAAANLALGGLAWWAANGHGLSATALAPAGALPVCIVTIWRLRKR